MPEPVIHTLDTVSEAGRPLLEASVKAFGMIPNLHGVMVTSPALLEGYQTIHRLAVTGTAFTPEERTVVWMTVNVANGCHYCVPAHTGIAKSEKIADDIIAALRDETPLADPKLEALRRFTLAVRGSHGHPGAEALADFEAAGFDHRAIMEVILIYAQKVMSNFVNAIFETPVDRAFEKFTWEKPAVAAE